ncbi:MAG TPA: glycosyltransferase [Bacteroidales bacterium]|nr:glycosyltransferase [Bacteroidales bacterium]
MERPIISVVMSIYNEPEKWLKNSIESILNQTFSNIEFIIVNDNPGRELNGLIVRGFMEVDSRIRLIENTDNLGLTRSLNIAFKEAHGTYIARMDADDISLTERLETQYQFMEANPEIGVCGCWAQFFGNIHIFSQKVYKVPLSPSQIQTALPFYNPLIHSTSFFRKSVIEPFEQLYDEKYINAQDYMLWEKLLNCNIVLANLENILLRYRVSKSQISSTMKQRQNAVASTIRLRVLEKLGLYFSEDEKSLMISLTNREPLIQESQLNDAEELLIKTKTFLKETDPSNAFLVDQLIYSEWLYCFLNFAFKRKNAIRFFNSTLFQFRFLSMKSLVKILI